MRRKSIVLCLLSNLIFSLCSNIDFKQSNVNLESKYEDLIYYTNAPMSREEYGTIDDYSLDSYEPSKIIRRNNVKTQIDLCPIGSIGPIGPIDPRPPFTLVTPENPLPTIYNGALQVPYFNQKKICKKLL